MRGSRPRLFKLATSLLRDLTHLDLEQLALERTAHLEGGTREAASLDDSMLVASSYLSGV